MGGVVLRDLVVSTLCNERPKASRDSFSKLRKQGASADYWK